MTKWITMLNGSWCQVAGQTLRYSDSMDGISDDRSDFYEKQLALLNYTDLERLIFNSEFVLNPDENDKIDIFDRIYIEKEGIGEAFHKACKKK